MNLEWDFLRYQRIYLHVIKWNGWEYNENDKNENVGSFVKVAAPFMENYKNVIYSNKQFLYLMYPMFVVIRNGQVNWKQWGTIFAITG